jgi:hypothetical protein
MGNSLHNKIYLGRGARGFHSRGMQALLLVGAVAGAGLLWFLLREFK